MMERWRAWQLASQGVVRTRPNRYEQWKAARPWDRFCALWLEYGAAEARYVAEWWKHFDRCWFQIGKEYAAHDFKQAVAIARDEWLMCLDPSVQLPIEADGSTRWARVLAASGLANLRQPSGLMLYDQIEWAWIVERVRGDQTMRDAFVLDEPDRSSSENRGP